MVSDRFEYEVAEGLTGYLFTYRDRETIVLAQTKEGTTTGFVICQIGVDPRGNWRVIIRDEDFDIPADDLIELIWDLYDAKESSSDDNQSDARPGQRAEGCTELAQR